MSTELLSPVTQPSLLYPALHGVRPRRKHYRCERCASDNQTCLRAETRYFLGEKLENIFFDFECGCGNSFFVAARLLVNEVLEEQMERIFNFTKKTGKEFGALVIRTVDGDIILDMFQIGENREVEMVPTHELREGEEILGTMHVHAVSGTFSLYDLATALRDKKWEKISIVAGADGSFNVAIFTPETPKIKDIGAWLKENEDVKDKDGNVDAVGLANKYNFLLYRGKADNLKLISEDDIRTYSLEELFNKVSGVKNIKESKK